MVKMLIPEAGVSGKLKLSNVYQLVFFVVNICVKQDCHFDGPSGDWGYFDRRNRDFSLAGSNVVLNFHLA